jgi:hypothetical protein
MTTEERSEQLATARTKIRNLRGGGRHRLPFYDAIEKVCKAGAEVKFVFRSPRQARGLRQKMINSCISRNLTMNINGNALRFGVKP